MEEKDEVFQLSLSIVRQRYVFRNIKPAKMSEYEVFI